MKISQKQASLLAKEVFNKLVESNAVDVSESQQEKIRAFKKKRSELVEARNEISEQIRKHDATLTKIIGNNVRGAYAENTEECIINAVKKSKTPSLEEIENRIILNAMFTTEDLNAFIERIVSEFTPKKKDKATA